MKDEYQNKDFRFGRNIDNNKIIKRALIYTFHLFAYLKRVHIKKSFLLNMF